MGLIIWVYGLLKSVFQAFAIEAHQCALQRAKVKRAKASTGKVLRSKAILITESEISKIKKDAVVFYTENFPWNELEVCKKHRNPSTSKKATIPIAQHGE